jgi:hypothetical protein
MLKGTTNLAAKCTVVFEHSDLPALVYVTATPCQQGVRLPARIVVPTEIWYGPRPVFKWYNSKDYDGSIAYYELQLTPDGDFDSIDAFIEEVSVDAGAFTTHRIVTPLVKYVVYSWRVRAWDGVSWSDWSDYAGVVWTDKKLHDLRASVTVDTSLQWLPAEVTVDVSLQELKAQVLVTKAETEDLPAQVTVEVRGTSDLPAQINPCYYKFYNLPATVTILPYNDLWAFVWIPRNVDLPAKMTVQHSAPLPAQITVMPGKDLKAQVTVMVPGEADITAQCFITHCKDLPARIWLQPPHLLPACVTVVLGDQALPGKMVVVISQYSDLPAKITLHGRLPARVTVTLPGTSDLPAKVVVRLPGTTDLPATVTILPYNDLQAQIFLRISGGTNLPATITTIPIRPNDVVLYADVTEATWQEEEVITFWWEDARDYYFNCIYYIAWNDDPDYEVTGVDENAGAVLTIDKEAWYTGHWYFHIRAMNENGFFSPHTTHFHVQFNHVPTVPTLPFLCEGEPSGVEIFVRNPTFQWTASTDADPLDAIHYHLQVATSNTFATILVNNANVSQGDYSTVQYALAVAERLPAAGTYYWRVAAADAWQESDWSTVSYFTLSATTTDLPAKVWIPTRSVVNLKAQVYIVDRSDLPARVEVYVTTYRTLLAKVTVRLKGDSDLQAKVWVPARSELKAQVYIIDYEDLKAQVTVFGVYGSNDLPAKVKVTYPDYAELQAKVNIAWGSYAELKAQVFITAHSDLPATVTVYDTDHFGFIDDFSRDIKAQLFIVRYGYKYLGGTITTIRSRPGALTVFSNVMEATWQGEHDIRFWWNPATYEFFPIYGYQVRLDHNATTTVSPSDQMWLDLEKTYDLDMLEGAGSYWFHVAAVDVLGAQGPTAHYNVRYNNPPEAPTIPMTVNGADSYGGVPLVASTSGLAFEWGAAVDVDDLDVLTYTLQISADLNFAVLTQNITGIAIYRYSLAEVIVPDIYYWRVRAFDGHEYSDWGPTAQFTVNTPPEPPTDLMVLRV